MAFNDIKLTHKLAGTFLLITAMVIGLVGFTYFNLTKTGKDVQEYRSVARQSLTLSGLMASFMEVRVAVGKYKLSSEKIFEDAALARLKDLDNDEADFDKVVTDPKTRESVTMLQEKTDRYATTLQKAFEAGRQNALYGSGNANQQALFAELDRIGPEVIKGYDAIFKEIGTKQNQLGPEMSESLSDLITLSLIVGISIAALSILLSTLIALALSKDIKLVVGQMNRLSKGDLSFAIEGTDRGDEIGSMAKAVDVFRTNGLRIKDMEAEQEQIKRQAEHDKRQSMANLADTFDSRTSGIIQALASAATEMQATASQMTSSSSNTAEASSLVAAAATEADSNVQTVASASEQLSASSAEIAKQITNVAQKSSRASHEALNTSQQVSELNNLADSIGEVIGAIKDIAEQTNLLALNATIEAARAGEAGKGFAVVADEVKKLAMETAQKTEQIDDRVGRIQNAIRSSVEAVQRIIADVQQIDEATTTVASAIEEQYAATAEIGRNVSEASTGTQQVAQTIISVQRNAEETGMAASTVSTAAAELARISTELQGQVGQFLKEIRAA